MRKYKVFACDNFVDNFAASDKVGLGGSATSKLLVYGGCKLLGIFELENIKRGSELALLGHPVAVVKFIDWDYMSDNSDSLPSLLVEPVV